jgi:hypothetical protein
MSEEIAAGVNDSDGDAIVSEIAVDSRVVVYPGGENELHGVVVDDFADLAGTPVDIAGERFAEPARRWAVALDDGGLVFVDDDSIIVEALPA